MVRVAAKMAEQGWFQSHHAKVQWVRLAGQLADDYG
jgi:hypothetical protein